METASKAGLRTLNADFSPESVVNLVSASKNGYTFFLNQNTICVRDISGKTEHFILPHMISSRPLYLLANDDGTRLVLLTEYTVYAFSVSPSTLFKVSVPMEPRIITISPRESGDLVDAVFFHGHPNCLCLAFSTGELQFIDIDSNLLLLSISTGRKITLIRSGPSFLPRSLFILDQHGHLFVMMPVLLPGSILTKVESSDLIEEEVKHIQRGEIVTPILLEHNLEKIPVSFGFSNKNIVLIDKDGDVYGADISKFKPNFIKSPIVQLDALHWASLGFQARLQNTPELYAFGNNSVTLITEKYSRVLISAKTILGAGGRRPLCLLAPGNIVELSNEEYGFTRVDPNETDPEVLRSTEMSVKQWDLDQIESKLAQAEKAIADKERNHEAKKSELLKKIVLLESFKGSDLTESEATLKDLHKRTLNLMTKAQSMKPSTSHSEDVWKLCVEGSKQILSSIEEILQ